MPINDLEHVRREASLHLLKIARLFKEPKITLLVRAPQLADGDFLLTDDDLEEAVAAIQRLAERSASATLNNASHECKS